MNNCQPCVAVKRWLRLAGVEYEERDAKDHIEYIHSLGYRQAPVTVNGGKHVYGFNIAGLCEILS